jgi:hypothetical protein
VAQSPEQELAEFMAPLPQWLQKILWHDHSSMTGLEWAEWIDSTNPYTTEQLQEFRTTIDWQPERYPHTAEELRPRFEQILRRCDRAEWKRYCNNAKAARNASADSFVPMPHGDPGRPRKDALAHEAAELRQRGMNFPQIAAVLNKTLPSERKTTPDAIRKLLRRSLTRTESSE